MVRAEYWGNKAWDQQSLKAKIWRAWKRTGNKYFHFDNGEKISTWWPKVAFSNSASFNTYFIKCKCWAYDGPHSVQLLTCVWLFATSWTAAHQASLSITNSRNLLKRMSIELVMPSNHLILCCPLLLQSSIFPSIRVFSNESVLHIWWPKYWSFSFSISPSNEYLGLISFRMDWLDLLAVKGILKKSSPAPQFKSVNSLVLRFLYSPTLTSTHDYLKNHSFD